MWQRDKISSSGTRMSDMLATITNQSDFTAKFDRAPVQIGSPWIAGPGLPSAVAAEALK